MFWNTSGICVAEFRNLQLYSQFVIEGIVATLGAVMQSEILEDPLRVGDVD